jgi:polyisoprenoid-binding protein YceI
MTRLFLLPALLVSMLAQGAEFNALQADKSAISFISKQMNVPVEGAFRKFSATIRLDPAKPEAGQARIEIDPATIDAGSDEANDELKGKLWFSVREFPRATFVSSAVKALGNDRFEVSGKMTIKGKILEVRAPFTLKKERDSLIVDGSFPLKRLDYNLGAGVWNDTSVVADEVIIKFHFVLKQENQS